MTEKIKLVTFYEFIHVGFEEDPASREVGLLIPSIGVTENSLHNI
jgi:hypothetical protein